MTQIDHQTRIQLIFDWLYDAPTGKMEHDQHTGLLRRYKVPEHLGDDQLRVEVNELVNEINNQIAEDLTEAEFRALLPRIQNELRRRWGSTLWPSSKIFTQSVESAVAAFRRLQRTKQKRADHRDTLQIHADRIRRGEEVAENYVYGPGAAALVAGGYISGVELAAYQEGAYQARLGQYGPEIAIAWSDEIEARHETAMGAALKQVEQKNAAEVPLLAQTGEKDL